MIQKFFRNAGVMAVAEMIARIKGVIVLPLLTRHLGPLDFGVWSQVSMIALLLSPLLSLGSEQGMLRILPGLPFEKQYRMFLAWMLAALGGAAIFAALLILANSPVSVVIFGDAEYKRFVVLAAASLFTTLLPNAARAWLRIQNDGNTLAAATVAQAMLGIVAVLSAIGLGAHVYGLVLLTLVGDLLLGVIFLALIVRRSGWFIPDFSILRPAVKFGLPLLPAAYAIWGLNWMDRLFLVHFQTLQDIGIYSAAYGLGYMIIQVFVNPIWALYPNSVAELHNRGDSAGVDRLLHTISYGILILSVPAIAGLWALCEPIMTVVAGPAFRSGALVMPVVALAYLFHMLASFGDVAVGLTYRQHLATASIVVAVIANGSLNFLLVPSFGIMGAAFATLGAFFVQLVFSTLMAARSGPFWRSFNELYRISAAAAIMALAIRVLDQSTGLSDVSRLLLFIPFGAVLYGGLAVAFGAIPRPYLKSAWTWLSVQRGPTA
ncbi:oligosaccharide flippase family protein [Bradyrhizobium sp.]|uniref:oligosaccharide flippase family protein n=1 Tax=Bradyrhizobium sp. TaxID=376 RepID=UPI003C740FBC